jgi:hypothetical protein
MRTCLDLYSQPQEETETETETDSSVTRRRRLILNGFVLCCAHQGKEGIFQGRF